MCFYSFRLGKGLKFVSFFGEICEIYFVQGAFIKITNIDFGKAMKRVMTLRRSVCARARGDDQSTRAEIGDLNYLTLPAKFTICSANYILLLELYTQKSKSFCLLSGKDQSDISPSRTPRWKCLFQPPDIYIPALTPFPSILIVWSCQASASRGSQLSGGDVSLHLTLFRERETEERNFSHTAERNLP